MMPRLHFPANVLAVFPLLLLVSSLSLQIDCRGQAVSDAAVASVSAQSEIEFFEKRIRPLLIEHCYACHSDAEQSWEGGLSLDSRQGWQRGGHSGPTLVPGDAENSLLIRAVRYRDEALQMPPEGQLSQEQIGLLVTWIERGAVDPRDASMSQTYDDQKTIRPSDPVAGREHWAFQPLEYTPLEHENSSGWAESPIDRFIDRRLNEVGLRPVSDADLRILVRRLYVVLTGLPPSPDQWQAFQNEAPQVAYTRLVDRLLSSPRFGERWGRHWLDLARYADSNGLDENFLFREAWRYRNWVIDAINADVPYDKFLLQQIAGDLLDYQTIEQRDQQRIAAGFLVVGPKVLLGNDDRERIMDVADEQLDTIGKTVLGQTLGCARCHDHKFDPIPTKDYYALAGILTSTQVLERRHMLGQQRMMEHLVGLGPDGERLDAAYETYWREHEDRKKRAEQGQRAVDLLYQENFEQLESLAEENPDVVARLALDLELDWERRVAAQEALLGELQSAAKPVPIPPRAMVPSDHEAPSDEAVRIAGQFDRLGEEIPRGFLQVIGNHSIQIPSNQSGRRELAVWLSDPRNGAGELAARVMANRIWQHMLGRGIVRTVDNFGRTGEAPTHPELLDYLAQRLIDSNWSIKQLVREIALSRVFRLSSRHDPSADAVDPQNAFLWRAHRRRLDAESLRDSILMVAGGLDLTPMDSSVWYLGDQATAVGANKNRRRTDFPCRSVYLPVIRNDLPELFDAFDFADPHATTGARPQTMVATQGLFLLNDDSILQASEQAARRLLAAEAKEQHKVLKRLFEKALSVEPRPGELQPLVHYMHEAQQRFEQKGVEQPRTAALAQVVHAIFASSRFQIVE